MGDDMFKEMVFGDFFSFDGFLILYLFLGEQRQFFKL